MASSVFVFSARPVALLTSAALRVAEHCFIYQWYNSAGTVWPSGLRRWLKAPFRKGVGSSPTAVISSCCVGRLPTVVPVCGQGQAPSTGSPSSRLAWSHCQRLPFLLQGGAAQKNVHWEGDSEKLRSARKKCRDPGSSRGPSDLQSDALPTELSRPCQSRQPSCEPSPAALKIAALAVGDDLLTLPTDEEPLVHLSRHKLQPCGTRARGRQRKLCRIETATIICAGMVGPSSYPCSRAAR